MAKIVQIIPYFGSWPEWMDLYLYSCSRNPMVDFLFFTDCGTELLPEYGNVIFHSIPRIDYYNLVSKRLDIDFNPPSPYKLTDLKPFLGKVHELEIKNYEWWGFGDIDLLYGNLGLILNERNLKKYSVITTHNYHAAGHCTFMRNTAKYRDLCFRIKDWARKLTDTKHYGLDEGEWSGLAFPEITMSRLLWQHIFRHMHLMGFFSFMDFSNRILSSRRFSREFYTSPEPTVNQEWKYDIESGKVLSPTLRELPYIHFLFFKKTPWLKTDNYWRKGYYKLNRTKPISSYSSISISTEGINSIP